MHAVDSTGKDISRGKEKKEVVEERKRGESSVVSRRLKGARSMGEQCTATIPEACAPPSRE